MFQYFKYIFITVLSTFLIHIGIVVYDAIHHPVAVGQFVHPDIGLDIETLVKRNGYPFEKHHVTTEDGYILELHRIRHGVNKKNLTNRQPILIVHGILESSMAWLSAGVDKALPYYLAEQGYDVWLSNCRGNAYSRKHIKLNPDVDKKEFFDYSWHEIGLYDHPATIDYVIKKTGKSKIFYAGHSQGSVSFMVMMSERPEYNKKIKAMLALAPVVFVDHVKSPTFYIPALFQNAFEWIVEYFGLYELLPKSEIITQIANKLCNDESRLQKLCSTLLNINGGFNGDKFNSTLWPVVFSHIPAGSATKQYMHYTRNIFNDFRKFDYGEAKNLLVYGNKIPPLYDLSKVAAPVGIFYGNNDWLTPEKDVQKLIRSLPNVVMVHKVADENFAHFDFLVSLHAVDILYDKLVNLMQQYN